MDIEAIVTKYVDDWYSQPFADPEDFIRAALTELAAGYEERIHQLEAEREQEKDESCLTCANRGRVNGLSQETYCDGCVFQESWRSNHYSAIAATKEKK